MSYSTSVPIFVCDVRNWTTSGYGDRGRAKRETTKNTYGITWAGGIGKTEKMAQRSRKESKKVEKGQKLHNTGENEGRMNHVFRRRSNTCQGSFSFEKYKFVHSTTKAHGAEQKQDRHEKAFKEPPGTPVIPVIPVTSGLLYGLALR